ncbi:MAG: FAD-dependent monooxygenase [Arhodomonas sp.]|nr:FAD-dependent monooxygenase [Arhodomonas sp.]
MAVTTAMTASSVTVERRTANIRLIADYLHRWPMAPSSRMRQDARVWSAEGQVFKDRFLIADVVMDADFPTERWFWFDPPFHPGQSVLLHRQADNVFRIDFQLGWEADPEVERQPERVIPRIQAMLGEDVDFDLDWVSVYTFQCRQHGAASSRSSRVFFAGDAAHQVSPFGARGANSGVQDVDNLIWKLERVMQGHAGDRLLETYDSERIAAADENILNSTRSTDFITPKSPVSQSFRDATLMLAEDFPFARRLVNSGRLSVPTVLSHSVLNTPDRRPARAGHGAGSPLAPTRPCGTNGSAPTGCSPTSAAHFTGVWCSPGAEAEMAVRRIGTTDVRSSRPANASLDFASSSSAAAGAACRRGPGRSWRTAEGLAATSATTARPGTVYLIRPDQHVAAPPA